nr:MAG TPA: hypothetical protein [Caudoviricetes sp.]
MSITLPILKELQTKIYDKNKGNALSGRALPYCDLDRIQTCNLLSRNRKR